MSKFIVTNGSYYKPFSYDEMVKPLQQMTEAHNATADAYDQLSMETEALRNYISDNKGDERAKAMYDNYVAKLNALQENLWNRGYSLAARRELSSARSAYSSDVTRLQKAITARQERSKEYWDAKHKNPELVTGFDPALGGLDDYLDNSEYGQNWFAYSGKQLADEVGADLKARASALEKMSIDRGINVPGYIRVIQKRGVSNHDVNKGGELARLILSGQTTLDNKDYDDTQKLVASVLVDRINGTGARLNENISPEEYDRLFRYGMSGASQAVMEPKDQFLSDEMFKHNMRMAEAAYTQRLKDESDMRKAAMAAQTAGMQRGLQDTYTPGTAGVNYEKAKKDIDNLFGDPNKIYLSSNGKRVKGGAEASELVYSGALRRKAISEIGFDIGRDAKKYGKNNYLSGEVTKNGVTYETYYDPTYGLHGAMMYRVKGSDDKFMPDKYLTEKYKSYVKQYEDTLNYYKKHDKELYNAAKMDPDEQYKRYKEYGIDFSTPVTSYADAVMSLDKNRRVGDESAVWMVRSGTDSDYIDRFIGWLTPSIPIDDDGKTKKNKNWRTYDGQAGHIHKLDRQLNVEEKTILDPGDVFTFDSKNRINNINGILLDENAILNGYLIFQTSKGDFSVGLDMFNSDLLNAMFADAARQLMIINQNPDIELGKEQARNVVLDLSSTLKSRIGYDLNLQSQGPTNKDDSN